MPVKKEEKVKKTSLTKTKSASTQKKTTQTKKALEKAEPTQTETTLKNNATSKPEQNFVDLSLDFNNFAIFDVYLYRELFMELRRQMDELYSKRTKTDKDLAEYDDAVYNITANSVSDAGAQDFMGFCYKKGFYDFCITNYEKYMKWSILAASNGNAFTLSKLQIYLTNAIDKLFEIEDLNVLSDFLDLAHDNFVVFLSKMLCEEIVNVLEISAEDLIKTPEKYVEQNEELLKMFDKAKMDACTKVEQKIKSAITELLKRLEKLEAQTKQPKVKKDQAEVEEKEEVKQEVKQPEKENKFKRPDIKKKFRY